MTLKEQNTCQQHNQAITANGQGPLAKHILRFRISKHARLLWLTANSQNPFDLFECTLATSPATSKSRKISKDSHLQELVWEHQCPCVQIVLDDIWQSNLCLVVSTLPRHFYSLTWAAKPRLRLGTIGEQRPDQSNGKRLYEARTELRCSAAKMDHRFSIFISASMHFLGFTPLLREATEAWQNHSNKKPSVIQQCLKFKYVICNVICTWTSLEAEYDRTGIKEALYQKQSLQTWEATPWRTKRPSLTFAEHLE